MLASLSTGQPCDSTREDSGGVSIERLGEAPLREVRRRLRAEEPSSSSKGLGRVEQGSEETARSLDSDGDLAGWSIWMWPDGRRRSKWQVLLGQRSYALESPALAAAVSWCPWL